MTDEKMIQHYRKVATAAVSDALRINHTPLIMAPDLRPVIEGLKMAGRAYTVKCYPGATYGTEMALKQAKKGNVLILAGEGYPGTVLAGEILSTDARNRGYAGIVVDGAIRDIEGIRKIRFPVYARSYTPRAAKGCPNYAEFQVPVVCANVTVFPDDMIIGDDTGVVVVRKEIAEEILIKAEEIEAKESKILKLMGKGYTFDHAVKYVIAGRKT